MSPLRRLTHGDFCSDDHQFLYRMERVAANYLIIQEPLAKAGGNASVASRSAPQPAPFEVRIGRPVLETPASSPGGYLPRAGMEPWSSIPLPQEPGSGPEFDFAYRAVAYRPEMPRAALSIRQRESVPLPWHLSNQARLLWRWSWVAAACMAVFLAGRVFTRSVQAGSTHQKNNTVQDGVDSGPLVRVRSSLRARSAIHLSDDFRDGVAQWESRSKLASWAFDQHGSLRPGSLTVFRPSMQLDDYKVEFVGQIEERALGFAFRIEDWDHYYALKLAVNRLGAVPAVDLVRYVVVGGREVGRSVKPFTMQPLNAALFSVTLDVRGDDFTLLNRGHIVDTWSDGKFPKGGVGFFCGRGERASIRWIEVTHHYDMLGRICALLTPYDAHTGRGMD